MRAIIRRIQRPPRRPAFWRRWINSTLAALLQSNWLIGNPSASTLNNWRPPPATIGARSTPMLADLFVERPDARSSQSASTPGLRTWTPRLAGAQHGLWRGRRRAVRCRATPRWPRPSRTRWTGCARTFTRPPSRIRQLVGLGNRRAAKFQRTQVLFIRCEAAQITSYTAAVDHFQPPNKGWMTGANLTDQCKEC